MCFVNGRRRRTRIQAWTQSTIASRPMYPGYGSAPLRLVTRAGGNPAIFLEEETPASEMPAARCSPAHLPVLPPSQHLLPIFFIWSCATLGT